ncbi:hypothetical protein COT97_04000 [Candidatus Falkowbacteria bacterium CG10_big_fil_rev_8_21_14_0_10_39_11]|uniref:Nudix hydrolase domain-containing protein n=1 Tax=Candidatus Falkowbacteria bacterium CG10_big_fil_rev_8_21_14_0_10_39_11 TaxID=1974565 RepID=A0A2H0V4A6_9BACT|nr:MAG: hypothetical protein COT97_04000 [Candidatus Falkowbacteria bacterium CG10_big_fil_rev_8_21_14_0_10_39_11]
MDFATNDQVRHSFVEILTWSETGHKIVFWPGRAKFPHIGHLSFLKALHNKGYKLLIGNGSCYSIDPRNPVHVFQIQVMLAQSLLKEGIPEKDFLFVPIPDFPDDDEQWALYIANIPHFELVDAVATDNPEVITALEKHLPGRHLNMLRREDVICDEDLIDICATQLREALLHNNVETWMKFAATGTREFILHTFDYAQIRRILLGNEKDFVPGRQCVDMVIFVNDGIEWNVLVGDRRADKDDFPNKRALPGGGIDNYESPPAAAVREMTEETGIEAQITYQNTLPMEMVLGCKLAALHFVDMYSSRDPRIAGTKGGSSLCFMTIFDGGKREFEDMLVANSDLVNLRLERISTVLEHGLAFQQTQMLRDAFRKLERIRRR